MLVGASQSAGRRSHKVDLQLQLRPPPVSPLRVVPDRVAGPHPVQNNQVLLQVNTTASFATTSSVIYNLIHWGMGLFCLPFLARIRLTRNVFRADISQLSPLQKTLVNTSPTLPEPSSGTMSGPDSLGIIDLACISSTLAQY